MVFPLRGNKLMINIFFTTKLFILKIPNIIAEVFSTDITFLDIINGMHEEIMHFQMGTKNE